MEKMSPEQIAFLATSIAVDLAKDKDFEEINLIKNIVSQVSCTLSTILCQRHLIDRDKKRK